MKIGFIGAGKVGSAFGHYLRDKGLYIAGYYSRSIESAQEAAKFTNSAYLELDKLIEDCDYIFITTPDDVIHNVWLELKLFNLQDKKIFHMSGSLSSSIFDEIENSGAFGYSLHPLFPFTDKNSYVGLDNAIFTIEGKKIPLIEGFLVVSGINYFQIREDNKIKYHAAAVFASNYVVCLSKIAKELLMECGIPENKAVNALYPLMSQAVDNIKLNGIENALTGPIIRGDVRTVKMHREVLGDFGNIYDELGKIALGISEESGNLNNPELEKMIAIFGGKVYEKNSNNL